MRASYRLVGLFFVFFVFCFLVQVSFFFKCFFLAGTPIAVFFLFVLFVGLNTSRHKYLIINKLRQIKKDEKGVIIHEKGVIIHERGVIIHERGSNYPRKRS